MQGRLYSADRDIDLYTREEEEHYCYFCERIIKNERAYRIYDNLICANCLDDKYGEEIE